MKIFLIYSMLLLTLSLSAQNDTWTYFSPPPDVSCLAASGNTILAGTKGAGLLRFDTSGNRTYYHTGNSAIPTDTILQTAIDAKGNWWIQHSGGISTYDASTWQTWSLTQMGLPANALIRALKPAPDSSLYVATDNGVAIFKNGNWSVINTTNSGLPSNNVWDVAFNPDGKIYFATSTFGVVIQDGSNWTSYTSANTGISFMSNVYFVACTTDGVLWILGGPNPSITPRLAKFEGGTWTGFVSSSIGLPNGVLFRKISAAADGDFWLTSSSSVSVLANQVWTHYSEPEIGCSVTSALAVAGDGQIWIQGSCQLAVFDGQDWYKPGTGLPGPNAGVFYDGIAEDATSGIWMGTSNGEYITRLQNDVWEQYYPTDLGASNNEVYVVQAAADSAVWFGLGNAEILKLDEGIWSHFDTCASVFTTHHTLTSATAPNGDQWFSFAYYPGVIPLPLFTSGLAKYSENGTWQFYTPNDVPYLQGAYLRTIAFDVTGTAWMSTYSRGILKYNGTTWDTITVNNSALPSNRVFDLAFAPNGDLWACTDKGLARFDGQSWTNITTANSDLPSNITIRIAFDHAGGMYVGYVPATGTTGPTVALLRNGVWSTLTPPGWENTINEEPDAFFVDSKNRLWFAEFTGPGAYRYDPMLVHTTDPVRASLPIHLSPNPCYENCVVTLETSIQSGMNLRVSNTLGQTILDTPVNPSNDTTIPIDVSRLQPGLYWVSIWDENKLYGRTSFVKI